MSDVTVCAEGRWRLFELSPCRFPLRSLLVLGLLLDVSIALAEVAEPGTEGSIVDSDESLQHRRLNDIARLARPAPTLESPPPGVNPSSSNAPQGTAVKDMISGDVWLEAGDDESGVPPWLAPYAGSLAEANTTAMPVEGIGRQAVTGKVIRPAIAATAPSMIADASGFPWRTIARLLTRYHVDGVDYYYACSAWMVGSFHLVTAGHCIYNWDPDGDRDSSDRKWADEVWVWPGQGDTVLPLGTVDRPYGEAKSVLLRSYSSWLEAMNYDHDWGVITINRRDGDHVGWMGVEAGVADSLNYSGYPIETPYVPAGSLVQFYGYDNGNVISSTDYQIALDAFIYGGHSGGPAWRFDGQSRWVQGIHSTSSRMGSATETRLTQTKIDSLLSYMAEDETQRPPEVKVDLQEWFLGGNEAKQLLVDRAKAGDEIGVVYSAYNSGFVPADDVVVSFYLSINKVISSSDRLLGTRVHHVPAAGHIQDQVQFTLPDDLPAGSYYLGWSFQAETGEYSLANNSVVIADRQLTVEDEEATYGTVMTDTLGYVWRFNETDSDDEGIYYKGVVEINAEIRPAVMSYLHSTNNLMIASAAGKGSAFCYLFEWNGHTGGSGVWVNEGAGSGEVSVWLDATALAGSADPMGPGQASFVAPGKASDLRLIDSAGQRWDLSEYGASADSLFYSGTVDRGTGELRDAVAVYARGSQGAAILTGSGTGVPTAYQVKWGDNSGKGHWINVSAEAGHGDYRVNEQ